MKIFAFVKTLTKYAIEKEFRVENSQSAFKRYATNFKVINAHYKYEQGLSMIQHQKKPVSLNFLKITET